jgi:meso-butanediol dehydrogenase / (S,S)-butanediol dehydrogenase / diacetyl reductase
LGASATGERWLDGLRILVTGAAGVLGRALVVEADRRGARVVATGRSPNLEHADLPEAAIRIRADLRRPDECRRLVHDAARDLGGLDIVVNNAGVLAGGPFDQLTEAQFDRMMSVNVKGVVLVTQAALPELRARGGGAIVNIASIAGKTGRAFTAGYAASKFAVVGLTQALAHEFGPANIRVNAVCPGFLRTTMWTEGVAPARAPSLGVPVSEAFDTTVRLLTPLGREQTPEDIGEAVVYLCRADNVTGIALNVAGGIEMH